MKPADFLKRLNSVEERILNAMNSSGRSGPGPSIVAVSKGQPIEALQAAFLAGQRDFGESYVNELLEKKNFFISRPDTRLHFIGALQSNKVRKLCGFVHLMHTLDRPSLLAELEKRASLGGPRRVLLEVKLAPEDSKQGILPNEIPPLIDALAVSENIEFQGLMTISGLGQTALERRALFARLRLLLEDSLHRLPQAKRPLYPQLSMGMSDDLEDAVMEGSTLVRVGSSLFGPRGV